MINHAMKQLRIKYTKRNIIWSVIMMMLTAVIAYANFEETDYQSAINDRRYQDAYDIIAKKDEAKRTVLETVLMYRLDVVIDVQSMEWPNQSLAVSEEAVDPVILKKVNRYMAAAKKQYLAGTSSIATHLLMQILYVYPDHPRAQLFLAEGLGKLPGTYSIKDQSKRLLSRSDQYFYGGNYLKAAEDLEALAILEQSNPIVFEKLGSAYYMMNLKQKALDAWTTALFLNPENTQLEGMIETTRTRLIEALNNDKPLDETNMAVITINDPQIMGVFKRQAQAFELTTSLRERGLTVRVEQNDDEKWVVEVSRSELIERNKQEEATKNND